MLGFKERCIDLRKAGHTLSEIVEITGRPKTSVYAHIRNIPLSQEKIEILKKESGARAIRIALARKGKSVREFKKIKYWNKSNVSLIAHLIFDGSINNTSCIYNNRDKALLDKVEKGMKEIYAYEPRRWINPVTHVNRISYHNVALANHLKLKSQELLNNICRFSSDLKREFVKSFFEDEGCVDFRPQRNLRQIRGYQKNTAILSLIKSLLSDLNIESRIVLPNEVVITGKENLVQFQKEVGFSHGIKRNPNRSNSIWKKPLEKRDLLHQAILSYKT
jgi:intein-encoded DNA endonuclease-like protein